MAVPRSALAASRVHLKREERSVSGRYLSAALPLSPLGKSTDKKPPSSSGGCTDPLLVRLNRSRAGGPGALNASPSSRGARVGNYFRTRAQNKRRASLKINPQPENGIVNNYCVFTEAMERS